MTHYHCQPNARAIVRGSDEFPHLYGEVLFYKRKCGVLVVAKVSGLPENDSGFYGFHIHEGESCEGEGFSESKGHYNPDAKPHPQHRGDLPPLLSCSGSAYMEVRTDRFHVREIIGRTVIIHSHPDDFHTQPSGDAGEKIACGVIKAV